MRDTSLVRARTAVGARLPAPASVVIEALAPMLTGARRARIEQVVAQRVGSVVVGVERLGDPHNAAAILRSADAFGVQQVHAIEALGGVVPAPRVAKGTQHWIDVVKHPSACACADVLEELGFELFVADPEGELDLAQLCSRPRVAVMFGNEHAGASKELRARSHGSFAIPMRGFVTSLNVSVAAAIALSRLTASRPGDLGLHEQQELTARFMMVSVRDALGAIQRHLERTGEHG
ncbi:MAG: RNA methyltransferase [Proteobacteria bacterium]|nr:RNA methyltransferase [Pseudomonadota bacterium]